MWGGMLDAPSSVDLENEPPNYITQKATKYQVPKRLNGSKLKNTDTQQKLVEELESQLQPLNTDSDADIEAEWAG